MVKEATALSEMPIRRAWISGLVGVAAIYLLGYYYHILDVGKYGWRFGSVKFTNSPEESYFFVLVTAAVMMYCSEFFIRWWYERSRLFVIHPLLREKKWLRFLGDVAYHFSATMLILYAVRVFYWYAAEYNQSSADSKYVPWFSAFDKILGFCWYFLPAYITITRALQHDSTAERKEPAYLVLFTLKAVLRKIRIFKVQNLLPDFDASQALLAILVKLFFVPLMTIFFFDQFSSFTRNWGYLLNHFAPRAADYTFQKGLLDFYNITFTAIFVLDVGLAWAGYVFASRWIRNNIVSVEPTFMGWGVALLCYPPFNSFLHLYFSPPSDKDFLAFPNHWFALILAILSLFSYFVYMSATIFFGLRFSNLTHRGIIDTGWYRLIRHPAYAGKNISWWLVMLPAIIYQAIHQWSLVPLLQILGLILMTVLYYYRAITEERHLSLDPVYQDYMRRVKYRFVPGLF